MVSKCKQTHNRFQIPSQSDTEFKIYAETVSGDVCKTSHTTQQNADFSHSDLTHETEHNTEYLLGRITITEKSKTLNTEQIPRFRSEAPLRTPPRTGTKMADYRL